MGETAACEQRVDYAATAELMMEAFGLCRGIRHTLLCGFLVRPGRRASQKERRLYIYVGTNDKLPKFPGLRIRQKIRPSPMLLQLRDFRPDQQPPFRLDRYELIDFDYA